LVCPRTQRYIETSGCKYGFPVPEIASKSDLEEILRLQKLAYISEAEIYNDFSISPLLQTIDELEQEAKYCTILKVVSNRKIIGSVRAYEKDGTCYIGKLMVHPQYQNRGIGKMLLSAIERCFEHTGFEIYTGSKSVKNLSLYQKAGYRIFKTERVNNELSFVYLEK